MCKIRCPLCRKRICDLIAIAEGRLGRKLYNQAKVYFHAKVRGFRDSMKRKGKKE